MKHYLFAIIASLTSFLGATRARAAGYEQLFTGNDPVSPRLVVETFSPWVSDNYPSLIQAVDLSAVHANGNRLYCDKREYLPEGKVTCHHEGDVWSYQLLEHLEGDIYVFRTEESSETGTYVNVTYRFFHIFETSSLDPRGVARKSLTMTLKRDVIVPNKASSTASFSVTKKAFVITTEAFQDGHKDIVKVPLASLK